MVRAFFAATSGSSRSGERTDRASILLPFLIISIGLGVLAWRSWQLSTRMEKGVKDRSMNRMRAMPISERRASLAP